MRVVLKGIHKVKRRLANGETKVHIYAWRGGPPIQAAPGTPEFVREYHDAHASLRQPRAGTFMTIIAQYKGAPEFTRLAESTRRAYLIYIKLIENEFGDLPVAALADRRVRGEFKDWRELVRRDASESGLRLDDAGAYHVVRQRPWHHRDQPM